jgi:hypothetical protein
MVKLISNVLLIFGLLSCASSSSKKNNNLEIYIQRFEKFCNCKVDIPVTMAHLSRNEESATIGVCYAFRAPKFFRKIELDQEYWDGADDLDRESLIFHELGHCVLDRDHDEEFAPSHIFILRPRSLMYPVSFYQYRLHRMEYIKELFLSAHVLEPPPKNDFFIPGLFPPKILPKPDPREREPIVFPFR